MIILVPLVYQNKRLGVMALQAKTEIYEKKEVLLKTLRMFSTIATLAVRNLELLEESKSAVKTRELFMSAAAHELRNPLTSVIAYSSLVEKKLKDEAEIDISWVEAIISNGKKLETLIKDLFSLSEMGMGIFSYKFTKTNLIRLVEKNVEEAKLLHKRNIILTNKLENKELFIKADPEKFELLMTNIIGNALKYSDKKTTVDVSLYIKTNYVFVSVKDQGRGIAKEDLPFIFEKFYRGQSGSSSSGFGLGMYLCKQITEAHNGEIFIKSKLGKGTTVEIKLPLIANGRKKKHTNYSRNS